MTGTFTLDPIYTRKRWIINVVLTLSVLHHSDSAIALPLNSQVTAGQVTISTPSLLNMHIAQESNKAIVNWNSFSIAKGESIVITQPSSQSTLLNRVIGNNPSQIFGSLSANGQVFLVNPNGILFAPGSSINAAGIVASTLAIKDSDFLLQKYAFFKNDAAGSVYNKGTIKAGFTSLISSTNADNAGTIITSKGSTGMAAGDGVTLSFDNDGLIALKVDKAAYNAQVKNSGVIEADGGIVMLSTSAADALLATVVNNTGQLRAAKIVIEGGSIVNSGNVEAGNKIATLAAGALINTGIFNAAEINAKVNNLLDAGTWKSGGGLNGGNIIISATGSIEQTAESSMITDGSCGGNISITSGKSLYLSGKLSACATTFQGGEIHITAPKTTLAGVQARVDGQNGGGKICIGGGWQGKDTGIANSTTTVVTSNSCLSANALDNGYGGTIALWSDQATSFAGVIEAKGGPNGGNGGKVEVSSHENLSLSGSVITAAPKGDNGMLLMDPRNITVESNPAAQNFYIIPLLDANPNQGNLYGSGKILELSNGNIIVTNPSDGFAATNAGAVRLYKPDGTLLSMLTGTSANDMVGSNLSALTGNFNAVTSTPNWSNADQSNAGAVTWINGTSGTTGSVSSINSLIGSITDDRVGYQVGVLTNGNYIAASPHWDNGRGAVSWGDGTTAGNRLAGKLSTVNSLVGSSPNDGVGSNFTVLTNGNYVVCSGLWDKVNTDNSIVIDTGAVTWGNGFNGTTGTISEANSLVGSSKYDFIGSNDAGSNNVTALTNGNYVVCSGFWDNGKTINAGAVTWGNGFSGTIGSLSADNSLTGTKTGNQVGWGIGAITVLTNGNYVVSSALWDNGAMSNAGAVTWGNGLGGTIGVVNASNSLVGMTKNDMTGSEESGLNNVKALTNGNYVVVSKYWDNGIIIDAGAVTWGNGLGGTVGVISPSNSLVGSLLNDGIDITVTALTNGNYVVRSPHWNNAAGAVSWGNGETGGTRLTGTVTVDNSFTGSLPNDSVGSSITALKNGNYVVGSPNWNNAAGAVTWGNGETEGARLVGTISPENSLIGSTPKDNIGQHVTALTNGNYVTSSGYWDKINTDKTVITDTGAVTWGNGMGGTVGTITAGNSLTGSTKNDYAGSDDLKSNNVTALTNGNYVVSSKYWDSDKAVNAGAVTWGSGMGGTVGPIGWTNSLVGSKTGNQVGNITGMPNGNYVVISPLWDNGSVTNSGAVTLCNGLGGTVGEVTSFNSMTGSIKEDQVGSGGIIPLTVGNMNGGFVVSSPLWLNSTGRVDVLTPVPITQKYASHPGTDNTFSPDEITTLLNTGNNVVLKANNDITINSPVISSSQGVKSGDLSLNAGRSILINARITTNGSNLSLAANDTKDNGVTDAFRKEGTAVICMAQGSSINTANGDITIELRNGAGNTYNDSGTITLREITANSISAINSGLTTGSGITLAAGEIMATAKTGSSIIFAGKDFDNSAGALLTTAGDARWIIYSDTPGTTIKGGLISGFRHYNATFNNYAPINVSESGNGFIYTSLPGNITVTTTLDSGIASSIYGTKPNATFGYTLTSSDNEDNIGNIGLTGSMILTGVPTASSNVGEYTISYGSGFSSSIGLTFSAGTGVKYTVNKRAINISANAISKIYGDADQKLTWQAEPQSGSRGLVPGDIFSGSLGRIAGEGIGTFAINQGTLGNSNYTISYSPGNLTVNPRPITLSATARSKIYGETDPKLAVDITSGSLGCVTVSDVLSDVTGTLFRHTGSDVGNYDIGLGTGKKAGNYSVIFDSDNHAFSITKRPITISADDKSKTYSINDPKLTWEAESKSSGRGRLTGDTFTGILGRTAGENVDNYVISQGSLDNNNYAIDFIGATLSINPRPITLHATAKSIIYGETDPNLTVSITSGSLGSVTVNDELSDITGTMFRQTGGNVGNYDIGLGAGSKIGNYAVTFDTDNNAFTITQRPVTITAEAKSKIYGDADPTLTWKATALSFGKGLLITDSFSGSLDRNEGENAGSYSINEGSLANSNYRISYSNADLTIDKRLLTLSAVKTYDGETTLTGFVTLGNLVDMETLHYTNATSKSKEVAGNGTNYINSITLQDGSGLKGNYKLPTLTVTNAPVTISPFKVDIATDTKKNDGGVTTDESLSGTVNPVVESYKKIYTVPSKLIHDFINADYSREFVIKPLQIKTLPSITACNVPEISKGIWSTEKSSFSQNSSKLSTTPGFGSVTAIEVHEPAMAFFILPIPRDTFKHNNPEAIVSLEVRLINGTSIPTWMSFDPRYKVLSGNPPQEAKGEYQIELIAKDQFGGEARTVLLVNVG